MLARPLLLFALLPILGCGLPVDDEDDALAQQASGAPNIDAGLAEPDSQIPRDAGGARDARTPLPDAGPVLINPPGAPFSVLIGGAGTGCPRGISASIAPDGETFEIGFSEYASQLADGQRVAFRDCSLTFRFHGTTAYSYAVTELHYEGDAVLEPNVRGFVTANHYSRGNPVPSATSEKRVDLTGPAERAFSFISLVEVKDRVWSPCGLDRNLQLPTRTGLQKTQNLGAGSIRLSTLKLRLTWRACS